MKSRLDCVFAVDDAYHFHAGVVMGTICRRCPDLDPAFWVVSAAELDGQVRRTIATFLGRGVELNYLVAPPDLRLNFGAASGPWAHVSAAANLRIHLPQILPPELRRFVFLDADVLCVGPGLERLATLDLRGSTIAAVRDAFTRRLVDTTELPGLASLTQLDPQGAFFNSGVMVVDALRWRDRDVTDRALAYLRQVPRRRAAHHDSLNVALYHDWLPLPKRYNDMRADRLDNSRGCHFGHTILVHSTGLPKHWEPGFVGAGRAAVYREVATAIKCRV